MKSFVAHQPASQAFLQWASHRLLGLPSKDDQPGVQSTSHGATKLYTNNWDLLRENLKSDLVATFHATYEADGGDIITLNWTPVLKAVDFKTGDPTSLSGVWPLWLGRLTVFLGFPSRTQIAYNRAGKIQGSVRTASQMAKNLIGGWDTNVSFEKRIWQWVVLPIKVLVILPIKLLTLAPKLLLNSAKLITEFLPVFLQKLTLRGATLGWTEIVAVADYNTSIKGVKPDLAQDLAILLMIILFVTGALLTAALYTGLRLIALVGRALTSPEKSARMAFAYGRELNITVFGTARFGRFMTQAISYSVGTLGAAISVAITATLWAIAFPVALGALSVYAPALYQATVAIFPVIGQVVTWASTLPLSTSALAAMNSALAVVGPTLVATFGPAATALSTVIGVQLSTGLVMSGAALGILAAPVATTLSKVADELSNTWTSWSKKGPVTLSYEAIARAASGTKAYLSWGIGAFSAEKNPLMAEQPRHDESPEHKPLLSTSDQTSTSEEDDTPPSPEALVQIQNAELAQARANQQAAHTALTQARTQQGSTTPLPASPSPTRSNSGPEEGLTTTNNPPANPRGK